MVGFCSFPGSHGSQFGKHGPIVFPMGMLMLFIHLQGQFDRTLVDLLLQLFLYWPLTIHLGPRPNTKNVDLKGEFCKCSRIAWEACQPPCSYHFMHNCVSLGKRYRSKLRKTHICGLDRHVSTELALRSRLLSFYTANSWRDDNVFHAINAL